jgi:hypothetical protein
MLPRTSPQTQTNFWYHREDLERIAGAPSIYHTQAEQGERLCRTAPTGADSDQINGW